MAYSVIGRYAEDSSRGKWYEIKEHETGNTMWYTKDDEGLMLSETREGIM